jgi:hypothetical protein
MIKPAVGALVGGQAVIPESGGDGERVGFDDDIVHPSAGAEDAMPFAQRVIAPGCHLQRAQVGAGCWPAAGGGLHPPANITLAAPREPQQAPPFGVDVECEEGQRLVCRTRERSDLFVTDRRRHRNAQHARFARQLIGWRRAFRAMLLRDLPFLRNRVLRLLDVR